MFTLPRVRADEGAGGTRERDEAEEASLRRLIRLEVELVWLILLFRLGVGPAEGGGEGAEGVAESMVVGVDRVWVCR